MADNRTKSREDDGDKESSRQDLRLELDKLEKSIAELRVLYEQYFAGLVPLAPEKPHADVRRRIRELRKAPFKSSALNYRLKMLDNRFSTLNTYWQRVLKQREEGTYFKDVFKSELREKIASDEARAETSVGKAEKSMSALFNTYKSALEQQTGKAQNIDFKSFQKTLVQRAKDLKEKHGAKKLSFKVVVKDGKVTIQAKAKGAKNENSD